MDRRTLMMGLATAGSGALTTAAAAQSGAQNPLIAAFAETLCAHDINEFAALFAEMPIKRECEPKSDYTCHRKHNCRCREWVADAASNPAI